MRLPIQYALTYPDRIHLNEDRLDLFKQPLEFFEPDLDKFRCLALAFEAIKKGGNMPCIVNAANEIVNRGFLEDKCGFTQMSDIIEKTMSRVSFSSAPDYDTYVSTDARQGAWLPNCSGHTDKERINKTSNIFYPKAKQSDGATGRRKKN